MLEPTRLANLWKLATAAETPVADAANGPFRLATLQASPQSAAHLPTEEEFGRLLSAYLLQVQEKCGGNGSKQYPNRARGPAGAPSNGLALVNRSGGDAQNGGGAGIAHDNARARAEMKDVEETGLGVFSLLPAHWLSVEGQPRRV